MRKQQSHSPQPREIPCHRRLGRVKIYGRDNLVPRACDPLLKERTGSGESRRILSSDWLFGNACTHSLSISSALNVFLKMAGNIQNETPRKSVNDANQYLCTCCNRFSPSKERPIGLFSRKANKEKIVDLILEFGHVNTAENDGCSEIICKRCFTKITKIQKLVTEFREACLITEEKQKETQGRSKRCRCEEQYQQVLKRHRAILPEQPSRTTSVRKP